MKKTYVYVRKADGTFIPRVFSLKVEINPVEYKKQHPENYVTTKKPPTMGTMNKWIADGIARTPDGCKVEPDGYCQHGLPSYLILKGMI